MDGLTKHITTEEFYQRLFPLPTDVDYKAPLKNASLILIDRWEDLFTPSISMGTHPLAHRILNTLKTAGRTSAAASSSLSSPSTLDISLTTPWFEAFQSILEISSSSSTSSTLSSSSSSSLHRLNGFETPMNAVTGSAFKTLPSLCYKSKDLEFTSFLRYKLMACNEEEGRLALCNELKESINKEKGKEPPPKKRGLGAEVSALVQSLIESPGNYGGTANQTMTTPYNPIVCCKAEKLIALSFAVIDAMQRSSAKQFSSICNWKTSFDDRVAREVDLLSNLFQYDDFDVTAASILKYFLKNKKSAASTQEVKTASLSAKASKSKLKATADEAEPVDTIHILLMTIQ
jgi:hypothetical protein